MKQKISIFIICIALITLGACSSEEEVSTKSNVAQLKSFYLAPQDSFPGFKEAQFKVLEGIDTGLVYVLDSIRFGTPIHRSVPKFVFEKTPGAARLNVGDTTITLSGSDTIDLSLSPVYLTIVSSDLSTTKVYRIEMYVHQVDPDLYQWKQLSDAVYPQDDSEQQVLVLNDVFYLFANNGYGNTLYCSLDAVKWTNKPLTGLPTTCHVRGIVGNDKQLFYASDTVLYTSFDGQLWEKQYYTDSSFHIQTMLMCYNDTIWAVLEDNTQKLYLGKWHEGRICNTHIELDDNFPISDFCAVEFLSSCERRRAMIIGGYTREGQCLNSRWNVEYSPTDLQTPYRFVNYSIEQPSFTTLTGVSVVWYNLQLLMFGGVDAEMMYQGNEILVSSDEGFTWFRADTTKNALPSSYSARQKQSVVVYNNNIYVIGGQGKERVYSDVYQGRLNSIDWDKTTN